MRQLNDVAPAMVYFSYTSKCFHFLSWVSFQIYNGSLYACAQVFIRMAQDATKMGHVIFDALKTGAGFRLHPATVCRYPGLIAVVCLLYPALCCCRTMPSA
jgi:hypothetical protein